MISAPGAFGSEPYGTVSSASGVLLAFQEGKRMQWAHHFGLWLRQQGKFEICEEPFPTFSTVWLAEKDIAWAHASMEDALLHK